MTIVSDSKYLQFKYALSPSNHKWYYVKRTNDSSDHDSAVAITTLVKIDGEYNFLFLKTKRPPLYAENKAKFCLESPAGLIGDKNCDEDLMECTKKELLEETGLVANKIYIEQYNSCTSAGLSSETLSFVTAIVDDYKIISTPISDGGIILERFFVKASQIREYLASLDTSEISIACATTAGIFYALNRI